MARPVVSPVFLVLFVGRRDPSQTVTPFGDPLRLGYIGNVEKFSLTVATGI